MTEKTKLETEYTGIRLSPTSINTYRQCPRKFYYQYIIKLPTLPSIHLVKGNAVHTTLENFYKKYDSDMESHMNSLFEEAWKSHESELNQLTLTPDEISMEKQDCINMLDLYLYMLRKKLEYYIWAKKALNESHAFNLLKPKFREKFYHDEDLNLCGFIDRISTDFDGKTTISDYKTSNRYGVGMKDDYKLQCGIYALLYSRCEGKNADEVSIIYIRFGEEVCVDVTPTLINYTINIVNDVNKKTKSSDIADYDKCEGKLCKWCNFYKECSGENKFNKDVRKSKVLEKLKSN